MPNGDKPPAAVSDSTWLRRVVLATTLLALAAALFLLFVIGRGVDRVTIEDRAGTPPVPRTGILADDAPPEDRAGTAHGDRPGFMAANKVVVFSLYGDRAMDRDGALANVVAVPLYYLSWRPVFVVDDAIPADLVEKLLDAGGTVIRAPADFSRWGNARRLFRFLVLADPDVEYALFRDLDSRISSREIASVSAWLQTNRTMRDHPSHEFVLPGGMWGVNSVALRSLLGDVWASITDYVDRRLPDPSWDVDKQWLADVVWPLVGDDVVAHDAFNCGQYGNGSQPFPLPRDYHGDFVGLVQDTTTTDVLYRQALAATFYMTTPEKCRLHPDHIYG